MKLQTGPPQAPQAVSSGTAPQTQSFHPAQAWSQRRPLVSSMLEEAGRVLHQVQRQKKVLEENIQALQRAQSGELLYSQLEALVDNR